MKETLKKKISFQDLWNNKQIRPILISVGVILLCAVIYVVLLFTLLKTDEGNELPTIGNHGEQMSNGRPFVVDPLQPEQIQSIKVQNSKGGYHYYRGEDNEFYFEGAEHLLYNNSSDWMNANQEDLSDLMNSISIIDSLMGLSRYMLANEEIVGYDKNNLASYGLDGSGKASMTLTYLDENNNTVEKTVYFGNITVSGTGYYVRLEGRDAVYICAKQMVERPVFAALDDFLTPQVSPAIPYASIAEITALEFKKYGEVFIKIRELSEDEKEQNSGLFSHMFETPEGYYPSMDNFQKILESLANLTGDQVVEWGITDRLKDPAQKEQIDEMFRLYSLVDENKKWVNELHFNYEKLKLESDLYISKKLQVENESQDENAAPEYIYYVYSPAFDVIAEFSAEKLDWIEWDLLTYMDNHSFSIPIDNVASVQFQYGTTDVKFTLQGTGNELKISCSTGIPVDTTNFRQLYKAILYTTMNGYADKPESAASILKMKITLRAGTEYNYEFFGLTARKAYYTLNGSGEFYVNRDNVRQLINACNGILAGEMIEVDRLN